MTDEFDFPVPDEKRWRRDVREEFERRDYGGGRTGVDKAVLWDLAHKAGLIRVSVIGFQVDHEAKTATVTKMAVFKDGTSFEAVGHAFPGNLTKNMSSQYVHMADTRATSRVLMLSLNIEGNSTDEMSGAKLDEDEVEDDGEKAKAVKPPAKRTYTKKSDTASNPSTYNPRPTKDEAPPPNGASYGFPGEYVCVDCEEVIPSTDKYPDWQQAAYAMRDVKKIACYQCRQKKAA